MSPDHPSPFDETYFSTGTYEKVSFRTGTQYWWSNRFYALLTKRYGPPSGRLLEVGCGLGHLLARLHPRYETVGVDVNPWALQQASRNAPHASLHQASAEDLTIFEDGSFQVLIAKHVVEHLSDPDRAIAEFGRVIAPGSFAILATPNLDSPMRTRKGEDWIGYRDTTHISLRRPIHWLASLKTVGFRPLRLISDGFWDSPYIGWLPTALQKILFGLPGGLQAIAGLSILPVNWGESVIMLLRKGGYGTE